MATTLQNQRERERQLRLQQQLAQGYYPGNLLIMPQQGPTAGVPVPGVPAQLPSINIPQGPPLPNFQPNVAPPSLSWPQLDVGALLNPLGQRAAEALQTPAVKTFPTMLGPVMAMNAVRDLGGAITQSGQPAPPAATPWSFGGPAAQGGNQLSLNGIAMPQFAPSSRDSFAALLAAQGHTITSKDRSKKDNDRVNGVANSYHLQPGRALDVVPKGMTTKQFKDQLAATGIPFTELLDEGDHVHIALPKDPFEMPALQGLDPSMANTLPLPNAPRQVDLPNAPEMPVMPDRPQIAELPVADMMEELRKFAPKAFDEKAANEGRLGAVLMGLAQGAASVDAKQGISAVLAAMGAGASRVATTWDQQVKADRKETEEAVRLFELGLTRQGIDWKLANQDRQQQNRERQWEDARDKLMTGYQNKVNQWETDTREYLTNNNILREYDRDLLNAKTARARAAMSIIEMNTQLTNQQITGQADLDLKRFLYMDEKSSKMLTEDLSKAVAQSAAQLGLDPKVVYQNKDAVGQNALQGLAYIHAKNKNAAINSLGAEVVLSGRYDLLPAAKQKEIEGLARQSPELAAAAAGRLLNEAEADPKLAGTALNVARVLAGEGRPLGTAFMAYARPTNPQQGK